MGIEATLSFIKVEMYISLGGKSKSKGVGILKLPEDTELEQMELHEVSVR